MKKYLALSTVFLALFALDAGAKATVLSARTQAACPLAENYQPITQTYTKGLIFKVENCSGVAPSYIMGTMHHDDPAFASILNDAKRLIRASDSVGFELADDAKTQAVAVQVMFRLPTDPNTLEMQLTEDEFTKLTQGAFQRLNMNPVVTARLRPWAAALLMQYPKPKANGVTLDEALKTYAIQSRKIVFGLEEPEEQFSIFANIPDDKQLSMLKEVLGDLASVDAANAALGAAYAKRDMKEISRLAEESFAKMQDTQLRDYLENGLIHARNQHMAERSEPYLRQGNAYIAVGALHLMGEDGVLPRLEKMGYFISVVK